MTFGLVILGGHIKTFLASEDHFKGTTPIPGAVFANFRRNSCIKTSVKINTAFQIGLWQKKYFHFWPQDDEFFISMAKKWDLKTFEGVFESCLYYFTWIILVNSFKKLPHTSRHFLSSRHLIKSYFTSLCDKLSSCSVSSCKAASNSCKSSSSLPSTSYFFKTAS